MPPMNRSGSKGILRRGEGWVVMGDKETRRGETRGQGEGRQGDKARGDKGTRRGVTKGQGEG
jgi:hypothetical protein